MSSVVVKNLSKSFGEKKVLEGINLEIKDGEFCVLVGPSGCGKSTLLRIIAGLEVQSSGDVLIGEDIVNNIPPKERDIAFVFQSYALYPHLSVYENIAFSLKIKGEKEIDKKVNEVAELLGLSDLLKRKPKELSGGQRQRVALGRAIVREPRVFLMDEPLSNLDAKLRTSMRSEIKKLQQKLGTTCIYVTHDQIEALTMGDRIIVLDSGIIQQAGAPQEVYDKPANVFVAGFMGSLAMNIVPYDGKLLGFRPDEIATSGEISFKINVDFVESLGSEKIAYFELEGVKCCAKMPSAALGECEVFIPEASAHWFDIETKMRI